MARGVDGRDVFTDDVDRNSFLRTLTDLKAETGFSLLAYCLMGNHFHLAIKVRHIPLSTIAQRLLTRHALTFNARHDRTGHLFQARYKAVLCVNERYLLQLIDYIHENPVRAGFVPTSTQWRWSSAQTYAAGRRTALVNPADVPVILGEASETTLEENFDPWGVPDAPVLQRVPEVHRMTLESLAKSVSIALGIPLDTLRSKQRNPDVLRAKRAFISKCVKNGRTLSEISRWLKCTPAAVHYLAYRAPTFQTN